MKEAYRHLYDNYLRVCRKKRELPPVEELKESIKRAERHREQLRGMLYLMMQCGEMTKEEKDAELKQICEDFCPINLYGAYMEDGDVYCFQEVSHG